MNILRVIPLSRSKMIDTLSYFSAADIAVGSVVHVPIRSKSTTAIVIDSRPVVDMKSEIKDATYAIRKLNKVKATHFFPPFFIERAKYLADYYSASIGQVIYALVPEAIIEHIGDIESVHNVHALVDKAPNIVAVQGDDDDRISSWKSLIRQEFAKKKSIHLFVPTIEETERVFEHLSKGIEDYVFILHSGLTEKKVIETWNKIAKVDHGVIVISTPSFSLIPRNDVDTIIIERENSRGWISQRTPYIDFRYALEAIYSRTGVQIHLADILLRTETLYRKERHDIGEGSPFKWRSVSNAMDTTISMAKKTSGPGSEAPLSNYREEHKDTEDKDALIKKFRVISRELEEVVRTNIGDDTHLFILASRRGLSPTTICGDCQNIVTCTQCSAPVVLHTSKESERNFFMCHVCGMRRSADELCKTCNGWKLIPLGIGTRTVKEELESLFEKIDIEMVDADETKTEKQINDAIKRFYAKPGSVLVGTETALLHLRDKIEHTAIASMDSFFALPDFRIHEKVMYILTRLRSIATRTFTLQTRRIEEKVFEYGAKGNLSDFYRDTLEERKQFDFPPFSRLIKITCEGKKEVISKQMQVIRDMFQPHIMEIFPAFTSTIRNNFIIHGLIKVNPIIWPDRVLIDKIRELPPNVIIKIDPETLL